MSNRRDEEEEAAEDAGRMVRERKCREEGKAAKWNGREEEADRTKQR